MFFIWCLVGENICDGRCSFLVECVCFVNFLENEYEECSFLGVVEEGYRIIFVRILKNVVNIFLL